MSPDHVECDVAIIGGGPGGAAAAFHLARRGHDVLVVEKKRYPREKVCGDGLTPRSVRALLDLGMDDEVAGFHRVKGLRAKAHGLTLELDWPPDHPHFPPYGCVVPRLDLDMLVAEKAEKAGVTIWCDSEATRPLGEHGVLDGAVVHRKDGDTDVEVRARYVIVADGSLSRFGRALGTAR